MLTEEDRKELKEFNRVRCHNCHYFNKGTGYCLYGEITHYKVCEPERYKRCENYLDRENVVRTAEKYLKEIKETLNKRKSYESGINERNR